MHFECICCGICSLSVTPQCYAIDNRYSKHGGVAVEKEYCLSHVCIGI